MERSSRMFEISDLQQLIKMFYAGSGTFFFLNLKTNQKFCLKFKRSAGRKKYAVLMFWSDVHVCFNDGLYFHLGRYNFKYQILQLSDETMDYNYDRLKLFRDSFNYVKNHIVNGSGFPESQRVFYDGSCARCGKLLEHPESLKNGIGPECDFLFNFDFKDIQLQIPCNTTLHRVTKKV